jgi:hypothetical protein
MGPSATHQLPYDGRRAKPFIESCDSNPQPMCAAPTVVHQPLRLFATVLAFKLVTTWAARSDQAYAVGTFRRLRCNDIRLTARRLGTHDQLTPRVPNGMGRVQVGHRNMLRSNNARLRRRTRSSGRVQHQAAR